MEGDLDGLEKLRILHAEIAFFFLVRIMTLQKSQEEAVFWAPCRHASISKQGSKL